MLQLERAAQGIKVQRTRQVVQRDLAEKRRVIKRLRGRVEEIGREVEGSGEERWEGAVAEGMGNGEGESVLEYLRKRNMLRMDGDGHGHREREAVM